ncbi:thiamine phosphate synthase [Paenibacillus sp. CAU 1782]
MFAKEIWRDFRLYVITAADCHPGRELIQVMEQTLIGGADILQLRNKTGTKREVMEQAKALRELTSKYGVPFIVNDHPDIALEAKADGVHLGQEDMPISEARERLGRDKIIGISTHCVEQALAAEAAGADYIGAGPVFPTRTKPDREAVTTEYIRQAAGAVSVPVVAIGGITPDNAIAVLAAGAKRLCAVSAIVGSEDPAEVCLALRKSIAAAGGWNQIRITLNGMEHHTSASRLDELVHFLGQGAKRLVAELDGTVVPRNQWARTTLIQGAKLELIHFVGGG